MKKLVLFFVLFFCSFAFACIDGLNFTIGNNFEGPVYTDGICTLTLKEGKTAEATAEVISSDYAGDVFLILRDDSTLLNMQDHDLKIESNIAIKMQGVSGQSATISSRGKNLTIDADLLIEGSSVVSSSGEDGADGSWHGPKDEGDRCKECAGDAYCAIDNDSGHQSQRAKSGGNAGILLINNIVVNESLILSASGGKGGQGAWGHNEGGGGQEAVGGGRGASGGNSNEITVNNMIIEQGTVTFIAIGGDGGNGGKGGTNQGAGDGHDGGYGGNGGNSVGEIKILKLENPLSKVNVFIGVGKKGLGGQGAHDACSGLNGAEGIIQNDLSGNFSVTNLSGYAPFVIESANNVLVKGGYSEDIDFFANSNYTAGNTIDFTACRLGGEGINLDDEGNQQISMTANIVDFNVWNPLRFFDRVQLTVLEPFIHHKNNDCDLNPKKTMTIPFNGRIHNQNEGIVKDIKIINLKSGETEFSVPDKTFSNGIFSHEITANLYVNFFYRIEFTVCNNSNLCELFGFNFFTWKVLW